MSAQSRWQIVRASIASRAPVVFGLSALAVAQPILDIFGSNGEFFVAGHYTRTQIVSFALIVTLVPPVLALGAIALASVFSEGAGNAAFWSIVVAFTGAVFFGLLRSLGFDSLPAVLWHAVIATAAVSVALWRTRALRLFASYLAPANLLFVSLFLLSSEVTPLVFPEQGPAIASDVRPDAPVVVVVFDELPVSTLMRSDGTINADRYPAFAELAETSVWYRNTSSPYGYTGRAIPAMLTGTVGDPGLVPTYQNFPINLFTLVGASIPVRRVESTTDLCPPRVCGAQEPERLTQALADSVVVYLHRILPESLRERLPAIDNAWGDFGFVGGNDGVSGVDTEVSGPAAEASLLHTEVDTIDSRARLHFVHVLLPHTPWLLSPTGVADFTDRSRRWGWLTLDSPETPGYDIGRRYFYQLHSLQVGAADAALGELLTRLKSLPNWRDVLLVVTADHGTSFVRGNIGRWEVNSANREELLRVPLLIKYPGQETGQISDETVSTIDMVPTMIDALGMAFDEELAFDGRSLLDDTADDTSVEVSESVDPLLALAADRNSWFSFGEDWWGLAAIGEHGDLVGESVADLQIGPPTPYTATVDELGRLTELPAPDEQAPLSVSGSIEGSGDGPAELLVAVNGRLVGVVATWEAGEDERAFIGHVHEGEWREGSNTVTLYAVETGGSKRDDRVLRPVPID